MSGLYFDLSIKIINKNFIKLINNYDFITSRDKYTDYFQNGILYIKNKKNVICNDFIIEILSGVYNEVSNTNQSVSLLFNKKPSNSSFFYGPDTLFKVYKKNNNKLKCKILNTFLTKKIDYGNNNWEFEAFSLDLDDNKCRYLQVKYIGYNQDLRKNTKNTHYSHNYPKGLFFKSPLNCLDKILVINLKHRTDRKKHILNEFSKFNIDEDKIILLNRF